MTPKINTIQTDIDIELLDKSGQRGVSMLKYAYSVLKYDGIKLLHTALHAGVSHVDHIRCASMLGFKTSTIRNWHSQSNGPIQSKMINGKPFWAVKDIRQLLGE